jgi:hypothetical protein
LKNLVRVGALLFVVTVGGSLARATSSFALSTSNPTCTYTNFGFTNNGCTNQAVQNLPAVGGMQGVTFSLNGTDTGGFFQNNSDALTDLEPTGGAQTTVITFTASGVPDTTDGGGPLDPGTNILLYGDFDLGLDTTTFGGVADITGTYTLSFDLTTGGNSVFGGPQVLSGTNGDVNQMVQNAVTTAIIDPANSYLLTEILTVNWTSDSGTPGLIVTIPEGSFDFNAQTPEPAAFGLSGAGLAALAWFTRRRQSR